MCHCPGPLCSGAAILLVAGGGAARCRSVSPILGTIAKTFTRGNKFLQNAEWSSAVRRGDCSAAGCRALRRDHLELVTVIFLLFGTVQWHYAFKYLVVSEIT